MKILKTLFRTKLAFQPIDPLGDGLREMIENEQRSPNVIHLYDDDTDQGAFWREVERDMHG